MTQTVDDVARLMAEAEAELAAETFGPLDGPPWPPAKPVRVDILNEGARLTSGERDVQYGPPGPNMAAAGELKAVFRKHLARPMSHGELEALDLVFTKLGRLATGAPKRDTYVDGATYFAIAGEIALSAK